MTINKNDLIVGAYIEVNTGCTETEIVKIIEISKTYDDNLLYVGSDDCGYYTMIPPTQYRGVIRVVSEHEMRESKLKYTALLRADADGEDGKFIECEV